MKKIMAILLSVTMIFALSACGGGSAAKSTTAAPAASAASEPAASTQAASTTDYSKLKIGLLLSGSANDGGWSQLAADAAKKVAEKYGCTVNTSEKLASTDYESTMRGYADQGYDIIVSHGAEFLDTAKLVAKDYPDTKFINTSALEGQAPNLEGVDFGSYEAGFICGTACGMATKSKGVGIIGALEADTMAAWVQGVTDGAQAIDPAIQVTTVYTGSFDDALKAKQAVKELAQKGCDTFTQNCDAAGAGAVQECDDEGLMNVGFVSDQSTAGESCFISVLQDASMGIEIAIEKAVEGDFAAEGIEMASTEGVVSLTEYTGKYKDLLTADQKAKLQDIYDQAKNGTDLSTLKK